MNRFYRAISFLAKKWFVAICFILLLACLAIRVAGVYEKGFWHDEILTMRLHVPKIAKLKFPYLQALDVFITSKLSEHTKDELVIRLPNIFASTLTVLILALWLKKYLGKGAAVFGIICLGISTCFIHHTSLCRTYGFLALFTTLATWTYWRWIEQPKKWPWLVAFILCGAFIALTRKEGLAICLCLIVLAPFLIIIRKPWHKKSIIIATSIFSLLFLFAMTYLIYYYLATLSVKKGFNSAAENSYIDFIKNITYGIINYISIDELKFSLHHNFRFTYWVLPLPIILLMGLVWTAIVRWRLAIILVVWIIIGQAFNHWLVIDFLDIVFDARHTVHTVPALIILFCAGAFSIICFGKRFLADSKYYRTTVIIGYIWLGACFYQYCHVMGPTTKDFIKYERLADWKQISDLSIDANNKGRKFCVSGHGYDFTYYDKKITRRSPTSILKSEKVVYYMPRKLQALDASSNYRDYDVIQLPYYPFPIYIIFNDKRSGTSYWDRACVEIDYALSLAPRHQQLRDALWSAWQFSGRTNFVGLINQSVLKTKQKNFIKKSKKKYAPPWQINQCSTLSGWGNLEKWADSTSFKWSNGASSTLLLPAYANRIKIIKLKILPFFDPEYGGQKISLWMGNQKLGSQKYGNDWQYMQFELPPNLAKEERRLTFRYQNPVSPAKLKLGDDSRILAMGLATIDAEFYQNFNGRNLELGVASNHVFLAAGWSLAEKWDNKKSFRWIDGTNAVAFFELDRSKIVWNIEALPFAIDEEPQIMTVSQDNIVITNIIMHPEWAAYQIPIIRPHKSVVTLGLSFNKSATPKELGKGDDSRELSAAISRITVE